MNRKVCIIRVDVGDSNPWAFALILVSMSVLLTYGSNLSGLSIVAPVLMHALFNISSGLLAALCHGLPTRQPELPYYLCAAGTIAIGIILLTRGRLGASPVAP